MNQARKTELRALAERRDMRGRTISAALLEALDEIDALERHIKLHAGDTISLSNDVEIAREQAEENFERAEAAEAKLAKARYGLLKASTADSFASATEYARTTLQELGD